MIRLLRSRWTIGILLVGAIATIAALTLTRTATADDTTLTARATRGDFKVLVTIAGDLRAKSSVSIATPQNADRAGAYQMKISSIVPEGTIVKEGDTVAVLDRSPLMTQMTNYNLSMAKATAVFQQAQLDTTLNLSKAREELRIMETALEERKIGVDQARYEAPSIKRQAEIDFQKAERTLAQAKTDYVTRNQQAQAKMREVTTDLDRNKMYLTMIQEVMTNFTIRAPAPGMVIYVKDYSGKKKGAGTMVNSYEGAVATLPDLTKMESTTYVNEIDVRKVAVGQPVTISLDSDPTKHLTGTVTSVANVGEERPNSDAKVFEVKILIAETDTTLRPGMTVSNAIQTLMVKNALSVPLEAVTSEANIPYVFKKAGGTIVKQEIKTGEMNDTHMVIKAGVEDDDVLLLVPPADVSKLTVNRLTGANAGPAGSDTAKTRSIPVTPPQTKSAPAKPKAAAPPPPVKPSGKQ
jgi:RND family efflux transporter MFP subunit